MARPAPYSIEFAPTTADQLQWIERKYHALIRATIFEQLEYEPGRETRNRKRLRPSPVIDAGWEIRFGPANCFRVLYMIDEDQRVVRIRAIGVKRGNQLFVEGEVMDL